MPLGPQTVVMYGKLFSSFHCRPCFVGTVCVTGAGGWAKERKEIKDQMPTVEAQWIRTLPHGLLLYLVTTVRSLIIPNRGLIRACSPTPQCRFLGPWKADTGFYF